MIERPYDVIDLKGSQLYSLDKEAGGFVSVYKIVEGRAPAEGRVGHITSQWGFQLDPKSDKTIPELMQEIRKGLIHLIS